MATIINNPPGNQPVTEDSGAGIVIGVIVALILIVLFVMYVVPSLRGTPEAPATGGASADINITLPSNSPAAGTTY